MGEETKHISDETLAARFRFDQDIEAFNQLHARYRKRMLNYIFRYVGSYQKAEDLTQEVFIKVYLAIPKLRTIENIRGWIYTIATNYARMEFRKSKAGFVSLNTLFTKDDGEQIELLNLIPNHTKRPDRLIHQHNLEVRFQTAILELPRRFREVFVLCAMEGQSYEMAAKILNTRKKTVSSRLCRARKMVIKLLGEAPGDSFTEKAT